MKHSCFVRKIDELGRIVLPIEIRQTLDIKQRDALEISLKDNGVFLYKNKLCCIFCNSTLDLINFHKKNICKSCILKLKEDNTNININI